MPSYSATLATWDDGLTVVSANDDGRLGVTPLGVPNFGIAEVYAARRRTDCLRSGFKAGPVTFRTAAVLKADSTGAGRATCVDFPLIIVVYVNILLVSGLTRT